MGISREASDWPCQTTIGLSGRRYGANARGGAGGKEEDEKEEGDEEEEDSGGDGRNLSKGEEPRDKLAPCCGRVARARGPSPSPRLDAARKTGAVGAQARGPQGPSDPSA